LVPPPSYGPEVRRPSARGALHNSLRAAGDDPAVLVVDTGDLGVPGAQPERGVTFPLVGEPDRLNCRHPAWQDRMFAFR